MKGMNAEQALGWSKDAGLTMNEDGLLSYANLNEQRFFIAAPDGFRNMMILVQRMAIFRRRSGLQRWVALVA